MEANKSKAVISVAAMAEDLQNTYGWVPFCQYTAWLHLQQSYSGESVSFMPTLRNEIHVSSNFFLIHCFWIKLSTVHPLLLFIDSVYNLICREYARKKKNAFRKSVAKGTFFSTVLIIIDWTLPLQHISKKWRYSQ